MQASLAAIGDKPSIINWTADENQDMIISRDLAKDGNVNVLKKRVSDFKTEVKLGESKQRLGGWCLCSS